MPFGKRNCPQWVIQKPDLYHRKFQCIQSSVVFVLIDNTKDLLLHHLLYLQTKRNSSKYANVPTINPKTDTSSILIQPHSNLTNHESNSVPLSSDKKAYCWHARQQQQNADYLSVDSNVTAVIVTALYATVDWETAPLPICARRNSCGIHLVDFAFVLTCARLKKYPIGYVVCHECHFSLNASVIPQLTLFNYHFITAVLPRHVRETFEAFYT